MSVQPRFSKGYIKSPPDIRDYHFRSFYPKAVPLPDTFSLRPQILKAAKLRLDQGKIGACVAFAKAYMLAFYSQEITAPRFVYSRRNNSPEPGMDPRDALDIITSYGIALESECPFTPYPISDSVDDVVCAEDVMMQNALTRKSSSYARIWTVEDMKQNLFQNGPGVWAGPVFQGWETEPALSTGVIPDPAPGEQSIGGHETCMIGWTPDYLELLNPWWLIPGVLPWGDDGCGWMPPDYAQRYVDDMEGEMWTIVYGGGVSPPPPPPTDCLGKAQVCIDSGQNPFACVVDWVLCELGLMARTIGQMQREASRMREEIQ